MSFSTGTVDTNSYLRLIIQSHKMDGAAAAARTILSTARELLFILCIMGVALLRSMLFWSIGYSPGEQIEVGSALLAGCSVLMFALFLNIQGANVLTVMRFHIGWAAFVLTISTFTLAVIVIGLVQHAREARKIYGISDMDLPSTSHRLSTKAIWSGLALWIICCATALYWLWQIGKTG